MEGGIIRKAVSGDIQKLVDLWEASVRASHNFITEKDIQVYKKMIFDHTLRQVPTYVFEKNGEILGFIGIEDGQCEMLFVHPMAFGKKIGSRLMKYGIEKCGVRKVCVNEQNPRALHFYQKLGFVVVKRDDKDSSGNPYPILHLELQGAIEEASPSDWDELVDVFMNSLPVTESYTPEEYERFREALYRKSFPSYRTFVYRMNSRICGYVSLRGNFVEMLYVRPEYMRQGIGTRLMNYVMENFNANGVGVSKCNKVARKLYEKLGFSIYDEADFDKNSGVYAPYYLMKKK